MQAIDVALDITRADKVNTLGFCVGGHAARVRAGRAGGEGRAPVSSMTLLTTMLDFADTGEIGVARDRAKRRRSAKRRSATAGIMQGKELGVRVRSRCAPTT